MSARGRDVVRYLRDVDWTLRKITDPIEVGPFVAFVQSEIDRLQRALRAYGPDAIGAADKSPLARALGNIGWDNDAGYRRWLRWTGEVMSSSRVVGRAAVEDALEYAGVPLVDLYPDLACGDDVELRPAAWCGACAWRVTPMLLDQTEICPWCDNPTQRYKVPPPAVAAAPPPAWIVRHRPRKPLALKPRYFDVLLDERRKALEAFAAHGTWTAGGRAVRPGFFANAESARDALRELAIEKGWLTPAGRADDWATKRLRREAARRAIRAALADGSWADVTPQPIHYLAKTMLPERIVREAAWLYFYDLLPMPTVAARLLSRTRYKPASLRRALYDEWDRRGWPRRHATAAWDTRRVTAEYRACSGINRHGTACGNWATSGSRYCAPHDPLRRHRAAAARRRAAMASVKAKALVDVTPIHQWLRGRALPEAGSVRAIHRRLGRDEFNYNVLAGLVGRRGTPPRTPTIQRSTVERILAAWGDGTTFEDIYVPEPADQATAA